MAGERRLNFGADQTDAQYSIRDDTTNDRFVLAEDTDGATVLLEYDETAGEWVSRGPVNMSSNDITNVATLNATSVQTESLIIGGTLYEEDDNSPINVSATSSTTYSVSGSYNAVVVVPDHAGGAGYDQIQVNGDTGSNYDYLDNADSQTTGATEWDVRFIGNAIAYLHLFNNGNSIHLSVFNGHATPGETVSGDNSNVSGTIDSITFSDSGSSNRDFQARVYGRNMSV